MTTRVVQSRYDAVYRAIERAHRQRALDMAEDTAEMARDLCPVSDEVKPVHLRDTIRVEANRRTGFAQAVAGDESQGIDYAVPVEFGGVFTPPHPFMSPAVEYVKSKYRHKPLKIDLWGVR